MNVLYEFSVFNPFKDLKKEESKKIVGTFYKSEYLENVLLAEQARKVDHIGYIKSGKAKLVFHNRSGNEIECGLIQEGNFYNIMPLITNGISLFSITSQSPMVCLEQKKENFFYMLEKNPGIKNFFYQTSLMEMLKAFQLIDYSYRANHQSTGFLSSLGIIEKSISFINKNYANPLTLDEVAEKSRLSKYYFCRVFKAKTGCTFKNFLNMKRIDAAKNLMKKKDMNVTEVCYAVGFNELSHFSRVFKKTVGILPSSYRKKLK